MAHKLEKLLGSRINNVPALIMEDNLREIVSYLESRDSPSAGISYEETNRRKMSMTDDIAMIPITGALTYESNFMSALCGMTSYQGLLADVEKAAKAGIKTFVLDADSGGGEAYAMMSTADSIRKRVDDVGGRIITYVDGTCASACFGLTAISDEIIAHPNSRVGSVGVVVRLANDNKAQKDKGYETTYITSAKSKVPFDTEGAFKKGFIDDIQSQVDELHTEFASHIATYRNMSLEAVNNTEAKVYGSKQALEVGFIDKIMNHDEFFSYLEEVNDKGATKVPLMINTSSKDKKNLNQEEVESMSVEKVEALQTQLDASVADKQELESKLESALAFHVELSGELSQLKTELESLTKSNLDTKLASRKSQLSEYLTDDEVSSVFESFSGLDDKAFNSILGTYKAKAIAEEESDAFLEVGVGGEGELDTKQLSGVMNKIKQNKAKA